MTSQTAQPALFAQVEKLPPLPTIVHRVLEVTNTREASAQMVADVLRSDQAIVAKLLRVANSPFYGVPRKVTQVSRAVVILGSVAIRNLVIGLCARDALAGGSKSRGAQFDLWQHSVAVAAASHLLAQQVGHEPAEEAFVGGLLHDIGRLAMVVLEERALEGLLRDPAFAKSIMGAEQKCFGCDHTQLGLRVLEHWKLPKPLRCVVRNHHARAFPKGQPFTELTAIVALADALVNTVGLGLNAFARRDAGISSAVKLLNISDTSQAAVIQGLRQRFQEAMEMFGMRTAYKTETLGKTGQRAVWISSERHLPDPVSVALLDWNGIVVQHAVGTGQIEDLGPDDMIIVDQPSSRVPREKIAAQLSMRGFPLVALLGDDGDGGDGAHSADPETSGRFWHLPRTLSTEDLRRLFAEDEE
jgi:putative nucleotidyltransferase with HDIG domain